MAKLQLADLANLNNPSTAVATINANSALIEAALENTVSRDGTSPNTLEANWDVNSKFLYNVPTPSALHHAVNKAYVDSIVAGDYTLLNPGTRRSQTLTWDGSTAVWEQREVWASQFGFSETATGDENRIAIQAALDFVASTFLRGTVRLPGVAAEITGTVTCDDNAIRIKGDGRNQTVLTQTEADTITFNMSGYRNAIEDLSIFYTGGTAGSIGIHFEGEIPVCRGVTIIGADICLHADEAHGIFCEDFYFFNPASAGLKMTGVIGGRVANGMLNGGTVLTAVDGLICLRENTEAIQFNNVECLVGRYSITTDTTTLGFGVQPEWNQFTNCIFDAADRGSYFKNLEYSTFVNCWMSGGQLGVTGYPGVTWENCHHINLYGCISTNSGTHGCLIKADCYRFNIFGGLYSCNSTKGTAGQYHGIYLEANINDITILYPHGGNSFIPSGALIGQGYDIYLAAGTSNRIHIETNSTGGNTGVVSWNATGTSNYLNVTGNVFGNSIFPFANDGGALGGTSQAYSDLFLASGGVVNWNNGNVTLTHATDTLKVKAAQGFGYNTGSGGAATQGTSKATTVQIDRASGVITMHGAQLNTVTTVSFTLTNSAIAATDTVIVNHASGGTSGAYQVWATNIGAGSCTINLRNISGGNLTETPVLNFAVIKGASS